MGVFVRPVACVEELAASVVLACSACATPQRSSLQVKAWIMFFCPLLEWHLQGIELVCLDGGRLHLVCNSSVGSVHLGGHGACTPW